MLKLKSVRQSPGLCGPAALKMVFDYYGLEMTEKKLSRFCRSTPERGTRAENMLKAASRLGFRGYIKNFATLADIKKLVLKKKIPVIVDFFSVDEGHYAVVRGIDAKNIYIEDPEYGLMRTIKLSDFKRVWFDFPGPYIKSKNDLVLRRMIVIYK